MQKLIRHLDCCFVLQLLFLFRLVMLETSETEPAILSGGPLDNMQYKFVQLHFHWGRNCYEGSETLINNQSYSMEMHAVFYNENYQSFQEALNRSDGLIVLAYFYGVRV